ncbi:MAG: hypothetical protein CFE37_13270 [Alphaproteobacteria bacterium PA4]|nr:MAG: hypothetical protein CFE37_13270 [Alphaproteobacteria bacterium PA4]
MRRLLAPLLVSLLVAAAPRPPEPAPAPAPWAHMPIERGQTVTTRPFPPRAGRNRCIRVQGMAAAQLFGDSAIEVQMNNGRRYRLFFARECPALSFYQGFYYRRQRAGQLCAGRDVIGARSGGECAIASIIAVRAPGR